MQIGEMFVNLGIKGTEKTVQAFTTVKAGLSDVASMSLEAKAALVGAFYVVQQMTSASARLGTSLLNFTALTGQASSAAERWGNAAKVAGGSFDEALQTFVKVQQLMMQIQTGQSMPRAFAYLEKFTGFDRSRIADTAYVMDKIRQLAKVPESAGLPSALRNQLLRELNFSDQMISLSQRGSFDPSNLSRMPFTSAGQQRSLDAVHQGFERMGLAWETEFKNLTSRHAQGVQSIEKLSTALVHLLEAADRLGTHSGIFALIDGLIKLTGAGSEDVAKGFQDKKSHTKSFLDFMEGNQGWQKSLTEKWMNLIFSPEFMNSLRQVDSNSAAPILNQTNVYHGKPEKQHADDVGHQTKKQLKHFQGQNQARKRGS